jgi:hypothetical protein
MPRSARAKQMETDGTFPYNSDVPNSLVIRTGFANQQAWEEICRLVRAPVHEGGLAFHANVEFLDDSELHNLPIQELPARLPAGYEYSFLFVVDPTTIAHPEFAMLVVDLESGLRSFRTIPSQVQGIENNLSIGNMGFEEFAEAIGEDGIFRGFAKG